MDEPFHLVQTNLREIDLKDLDIEVYVNSIKEIGANTVLMNIGGIVANYNTQLPFQYRNLYLKSDLFGELVDRLHQEGILVIGCFDYLCRLLLRGGLNTLASIGKNSGKKITTVS